MSIGQNDTNDVLVIFVSDLEQFQNITVLISLVLDPLSRSLIVKREEIIVS